MSAETNLKETFAKTVQHFFTFSRSEFVPFRKKVLNRSFHIDAIISFILSSKFSREPITWQKCSSKYNLQSTKTTSTWLFNTKWLIKDILFSQNFFVSFPVKMSDFGSTSFSCPRQVDPSQDQRMRSIFLRLCLSNVFYGETFGAMNHLEKGKKNLRCYDIDFLGGYFFWLSLGSICWPSFLLEKLMQPFGGGKNRKFVGRELEIDFRSGLARCEQRKRNLESSPQKLHKGVTILEMKKGRSLTNLWASKIFS